MVGRRSNRSNQSRERAIKSALLRAIRDSGVGLDEVKEWLWEDFGIRVSGGWERVERVVVREKEVRAQDLVAFMDELGLEPDEGAWGVTSVPRLRGRADSGEGGSER